MTNGKAINILLAIKKGTALSFLSDETIARAVDIAISALEKQEQSNAQNVNSTHRSCTNALESLNILEQAKDDKGCVPMSLVRQAFRNILEKNRWIPVTERLPEEKDAGILKKLGTDSHPSLTRSWTSIL